MFFTVILILWGTFREKGNVNKHLIVYCNDRFKINVFKKLSKFVNGEGVLAATEAENLALIRDHERSPHHQLVVAKLQDMTIEELLNEDFDYKSGNYYDRIYDVTIKMFRLIYLGWIYLNELGISV